MEISPFTGGSILSKRRSGYNRTSPKNRRNLKVARLGAEKRSWRLRLAPKLRLMSPLKLWSKMKKAYLNMATNSSNVFDAKRIPKSGDVKMEYSRTEFQNRLVFEIYKSMSASLELGHTNH